MKVVKIFLRVIGLLLVLMVGAAVVLVNLVNPNDYKPEIAAQVKEATGRELTMKGDIELAFFPWLGLKTGSVALSNRQGFGQTPMLAMEEVDIKIKLLPLLKKRVEVNTVLLRKPRIILSRKADGTTNWDDLVDKIQPRGASANRKSPPDAALLAGLAVQGVSIQDGFVKWDDGTTGESLTLEALNLNTGTLEPGTPMKINASVEAMGSMFPEPTTLSLATTAQLAKNFQSFFLDNTGFKVATPNIATNFSVEKVSFALQAGLAAVVGLSGTANRQGVNTSLEIPSLNFNFSDESLQVPGIEITQEDFHLSGSATGTKMLSSLAALTMSGNMDARIEDLSGVLKRNGFVAVPLPGKANAVLAGFQYTLANSTLTLADLTVASLAKPDGELLFNQKKITIPIKADGSLAYSSAASRLLWTETKKGVNKWLLQKIAPGDSDGDDGASLKEVAKEKLKKSLLKVLGKD